MSKNKGIRVNWLLDEETPSKVKGAENQNKIWSDSEVKYLLDHYPQMSALSIGKVLGRSEKSINQKLHHLRVKGEKIERRVPVYQDEVPNNIKVVPIKTIIKEESPQGNTYWKEIMQVAYLVISVLMLFACTLILVLK